MSYKPDCEDCPTPKECQEKDDCQTMRQIRHPVRTIEAIATTQEVSLFYPERDNTKDPTPWAVLCTCLNGDPNSGDEVPVFLTEVQYLAQLNNPDFPWKCPSCGSCAEWDNDCRETNPPDKVDAGDHTCTSEDTNNEPEPF